MSVKKPSHHEDEYILRQEALEKHKLARARAKQMAYEEKLRRRREHFMKCPKCGMDLEKIIYRGVSIDKCFDCGGSWLDEGDLERLAGRSGDVLSCLVEIFKPGPGPVGPG